MDEFMHRIGTRNQQGAGMQRYREMSIEDLLLENRIVFLAGPIVERNAAMVIMRMLYLQSVRRDQDVHLYINSPGGLVGQTLAIYDTMSFLGCDINTYCIGEAASGAAILLAAGTKGKRFGLPNAKVMLHQPYGGITGQAEDIRIQAEEVIREKKLLAEILAKHTGQSYDRITAETERDRYMSVSQAKEYGLIDEVLAEAPSKKK